MSNMASTPSRGICPLLDKMKKTGPECVLNDDQGPNPGGSLLGSPAHKREELGSRRSENKSSFHLHLCSIRRSSVPSLQILCFSRTPSTLQHPNSCPEAQKQTTGAHSGRSLPFPGLHAAPGNPRGKCRALPPLQYHTETHWWTRNATSCPAMHVKSANRPKQSLLSAGQPEDLQASSRPHVAAG